MNYARNCDPVRRDDLSSNSQEPSEKSDLQRMLEHFAEARRTPIRPNHVEEGPCGYMTLKPIR